jgi:hypothetical protein
MRAATRAASPRRTSRLHREEPVVGHLCEDSARRRKQPVDLRHGIKKGAVEVQIKLICAALLRHSGAPMARG